MPTIVPRHRYVQRARGADSFIASMSRDDMIRFSSRIIDKRWPDVGIRELLESLLPPGGVMTAEVGERFRAARLARDSFDSGSSRLACAHDGRYWSTARTWSRNVPWYPLHEELEAMSPYRPLHPHEVTLLLHSQCDESGFHALHRCSPDVTDVPGALARTVLIWSANVEEWP